MSYLIGQYGWYEGTGDSLRSTEIEPSNKSTSVIAGTMRSIWNEKGWSEIPYVIPDRTGEHDRLKASMIAEISATATALEDGYVMLDGNPIPTDLVAQGRITSARATLNRRGTGTVKFAGMGTLNEAQLTAMEDAVFDKVVAIQDNHSDLYDAIMVSDDHNLIDINAAWPA